MVLVKGKMDGAKYSDILKQNLSQSVSDLRLGWRFTFQQNNDPMHIVKSTLKWFKGKGYIGGLSTALQNAVDKPLMPYVMVFITQTRGQRPNFCGISFVHKLSHQRCSPVSVLIMKRKSGLQLILDILFMFDWAPASRVTTPHETPGERNHKSLSEKYFTSFTVSTGKKSVSTEGEVVLTHMKKLIDEYENDSISAHSLNGDRFDHTDAASDCPSDVPAKEDDICELPVRDPLQQFKRMYKFESEDSGVEMPSGANSPSTPKGSEKSFVMHSRDSSCDSGVLSASSSPTVGHMEISDGGATVDVTHTFLSNVKKFKDHTDLSKEHGDENENSVEDFIDCQEEELDLPPCNEENEPSAIALFNTELSSTMEEEAKAMGDFYKDTFEDIQNLHQLKRCPTSDSLDEYMDECCRLSELKYTYDKNYVT
ncbi:unnamed protein product [Ranitomeya imitator]|uniref:Uncharacterized protein n=1 Tax=Ranitomeya imitator TaxID=111125 RepID=A0ABN9MGR1_9NEOB|nr:unnamed protein product [Ranitomeya imitator]